MYDNSCQVTDDFTITLEECCVPPELNSGAFINACEDPINSMMSNFTLETAEDLAFGDVDGDGADGSTAIVTYYTTLQDAENMTNPLVNGMGLFTTTIYARVQVDDCYSIESVSISVIVVPELTLETSRVSACGLEDGCLTINGLNLADVDFRIFYNQPDGTNEDLIVLPDSSGQYILCDLLPGTYNNLFLNVSGNGINCSGRTMDFTIEDAEMPISEVSDITVCEGTTSAPIVIMDNGCPVTHILIDFDDPSFTDVSNLTAFSPGDSLIIPSGLAVGDYTATMTFVCDNSCVAIDDFTITVVGMADAGRDSIFQICNEDPTQFSFDLFEVLAGTPDMGGIWTETSTTSSGVTIGNGDLGTVNFQGIAPGTYTFNYAIEDVAPCELGNSTLTVTVTSCFDLALTKVLTSNPVSRLGDVVTFDITVENQGSVNAYDVSVADYFPSCLVYGNAQYASHNSGLALPVITDNGVDGFVISEIPASSSVVVTLTMTIDAACLDTTIINNAEITGGASSPGGPTALDADSVPGDDSNSPPDGNDNDTGDSAGGDDFDPATLTICQTGCNGAFPWNGNN